jgi:hypothetical protein
MSSSGRESITPIDVPVFTRPSFRSKRRFCYRLLVSPLQDAGYFALSMLKRFEAQAFEALHQELGLTPFCVRNVSRVPNDPSARISPPTTAPSRLATDTRTGARRRATIFGTTLLRSPNWAEHLVSANTPVNKSPRPRTISTSP